MAAKTENTYISESTIDIIKIPTENLGFRPRRARRKCSGDCDNYPAATGNSNSHFDAMVENHRFVVVA